MLPLLIPRYDKKKTPKDKAKQMICTLTFLALPVNVQRCSWLLGGILLSVSCLGTCMSCTCCAEEADKVKKKTNTRNIPDVSALNQELKISFY